MVNASALIAFFLMEEGWRSLAPYTRYTLSVDHIVKEFYNAIWEATCVKKFTDYPSTKTYFSY